MALWVKRLLRRPYTEADLQHFVTTFTKKPPVADDDLRYLYESRSESGKSVFETWRTTFTTHVATIASHPTFLTQREEVVRHILAGSSWRNLYTLSKSARHVRAWSHYLDSAGRAQTDDQLKQFVYSAFLTAYISFGCLIQMGQSLYNLPAAKTEEYHCFDACDLAVRRRDVSIKDRMHDWIDADRVDNAWHIARVNDSVVAPVLLREFAALEWMQDQIVFGSLDLKAATARRKASSKERERVSATLSAHGIPARP